MNRKYTGLDFAIYYHYPGEAQSGRIPDFLIKGA